MTIQERLDAIKKEYAESEQQVRNITQHMLRLEGAFQVLTDQTTMFGGIVCGIVSRFIVG
jgi:hypothetical protein